MCGRMSTPLVATSRGRASGERCVQRPNAREPTLLLWRLWRLEDPRPEDGAIDLQADREVGGPGRYCYARAPCFPSSWMIPLPRLLKGQFRQRSVYRRCSGGHPFRIQMSNRNLTGLIIYFKWPFSRSRLFREREKRSKQKIKIRTSNRM